MRYKILETHCVYESGKLKEVFVLWDDFGSSRATYSSLNPKAGYQQLTEADEITPQLIQNVAAAGSYLDDEQKQIFFPGVTNWSR